MSECNGMVKRRRCQKSQETKQSQRPQHEHCDNRHQPDAEHSLARLWKQVQQMERASRVLPTLSSRFRENIPMPKGVYTETERPVHLGFSARKSSKSRTPKKTAHELQNGFLFGPWRSTKIVKSVKKSYPRALSDPFRK